MQKLISRGLCLGFFLFYFLNCYVCARTGNILGKLETKIFYFTSTKTRNNFLCMYENEKQKKYFFDFSNCNKCVKTRNSEIALPLPSTRSGIPPSKTLST